MRASFSTSLDAICRCDAILSHDVAAIAFVVGGRVATMYTAVTACEPLTVGPFAVRDQCTSRMQGSIEHSDQLA
jgi:hypothetical protein